MRGVRHGLRGVQHGALPGGAPVERLDRLASGLRAIESNYYYYFDPKSKKKSFDHFSLAELKIHMFHNTQKCQIYYTDINGILLMIRIHKRHLANFKIAWLAQKCLPTCDGKI